MPRRAASGDQPRTCTISVRLTEAERALVDERAAKAGKTNSAYAAELVTTGRVVVKVRPGLNAGHMAELKRIGNNLNQMATAMNAGRSVPVPALESVLAELRALIAGELATRLIAQTQRNRPDGPETESERNIVSRPLKLSFPR